MFKHSEIPIFCAEMQNESMLLSAGVGWVFRKKGRQTAACPPDISSYKMRQMVRFWAPVCRSAMMVLMRSARSRLPKKAGGRFRRRSASARRRLPLSL